VSCTQHITFVDHTAPTILATGRRRMASWAVTRRRRRSSSARHGKRERQPQR
jgi:hypothetical protein